MEWVQANWSFILFAAIFIGMHLFGFGCGSHGKHGGHGGNAGDDERKHIGNKSAGKKEGSSCH